MALISSQALFHFTANIDNLVSILDHGFHVRYSLEKIPYGEDEIEIAIPMVCFCDIPLSNINNHTQKYGCYGIGLTKEWGRKKELNPLLYLSHNSNLYILFRELGNYIYYGYEELQQRQVGSFWHSRSNELFHEILWYTKPYSGDLIRQGEIIKDVIFYNEKEWRYIKKGILLHMEKEDFQNSIKRKEQDEFMKKIGTLEFDHNDIKYIIIKQENERKMIIDKLKNSKVPDTLLDQIISKVMTYEQIEDDF